MRKLTDISLGSVSLLLPIYSYYSVLVSYRLLHEATYRLSFRFLGDAIGFLIIKKKSMNKNIIVQYFPTNF